MLLQNNRDLLVLGQASTGRQAIEMAAALKPDLVIMDIAMPKLNGFEAARQIKLASPATKILVLSAHSDDEYVAHMCQVGASGYLMKQNSGQELLHAIDELAAGRTFFSQAISARMNEAKRKAREVGSPANAASRPLTSREAEVLQLVAEGAANKQIGASLGISIKTVEKHRQQLMNKLNIHDTAGLTRHAIAMGIIESCSQRTTS